MRFVAVIFIWIILIGGLKLFLSARQTPRDIEQPQPTSAQNDYHLDFTCTFTAKPDPFALDVDETHGALAVSILLAGQILYQATDAIEAGQIITVTPLPDLKIGKNEFYIEGHPPVDHADKAHAMRLRFYRNNQVLQEKTFWADSGESVTGSFIVSIDESESVEADDHGH